mmetsp:Transcript_66535/g.138696  ORF Transcript_66535/g.138696 Transcript_66535/m.138696 type:complete len:221 (+) Transcript_66535:273-935(+)
MAWRVEGEAGRRAHVRPRAPTCAEMQSLRSQMRARLHMSTTKSPGWLKTSSSVLALCTVYPRICTMSSDAPSSATIVHPSFATESFFTTTLAPGAARMTSAPSSSSLPWMWISPSSTRALLAEIFTCASGAIRFLMLERHVPKEGWRTTMGLKSRLMPPKDVGLPSVGTSQPAILRSWQLSDIASRSALPALSTGMPCSPFALASLMLFLTGEKQMKRGS